MINTMIAYAADTTTVVASSKCGASIKDFTSLIDCVSSTLANSVVPLLIGIAVAAFIYGIISYFLNPNNEEKRKQGKSFMLWGVIALFVMVSFWGIVNIFQNTFTKGVSSEVKMPKLPQ